MATQTNTTVVDAYVDWESEHGADASAATYVDRGRNPDLTVPAKPSGGASGEHAPDLWGANAWLAECGYPRAVALADECSTPSADTVRQYDRRGRRP